MSWQEPTQVYHNPSQSSPAQAPAQPPVPPPPPRGQSVTMQRAVGGASGPATEAPGAQRTSIDVASPISPVARGGQTSRSTAGFLTALEGAWGPSAEGGRESGNGGRAVPGTSEAAPAGDRQGATPAATQGTPARGTQATPPAQGGTQTPPAQGAQANPPAEAAPPRTPEQISQALQQLSVAERTQVAGDVAQEVRDRLGQVKSADEAVQLLNQYNQFVGGMGLDMRSDSVREAMKPLAEAFKDQGLQQKFADASNQYRDGLQKYLVQTTSVSPAANAVARVNGRLGEMGDRFQADYASATDFSRRVSEGAFRDNPEKFLEEYAATRGTLDGLRGEAEQFAQDINRYRGGMKTAITVAASLPAIPFGVGAATAGSALAAGTITAGTGGTAKEAAVDALSAAVGNLVGFGVFKGAGPALQKLMNPALARTVAGGTAGAAGNLSAAQTDVGLKQGRLLTPGEAAFAGGTGFAVGAPLGLVLGPRATSLADDGAAASQSAGRPGGTVADAPSAPVADAPAAPVADAPSAPVVEAPASGAPPRAPVVDGPAPVVEPTASGAPRPAASGPARANVDGPASGRPDVDGPAPVGDLQATGPRPAAPASPSAAAGDDAVQALKRVTDPKKVAASAETEVRLQAREAQNRELLGDAQRVEQDLAAAGVDRQRLDQMMGLDPAHPGERLPLAFESYDQLRHFQQDMAEALSKTTVNGQPVTGRAKLIGTSAEFYSGNPNKQLGHHFDRLGPKTGDIDIDLASPELARSMAATPGAQANPKVIQAGEHTIFKNTVTDELGRVAPGGFHTEHPQFEELCRKWTEILGREVDIKLRLDTTPVGQLPPSPVQGAGPIDLLRYP